MIAFSYIFFCFIHTAFVEHLRKLIFPTHHSACYQFPSFYIPSSGFMSHTVHFPIIPSQPFFLWHLFSLSVPFLVAWTIPHVYTYTYRNKNKRFTYERIAVAFVFSFSWILVLTFKCILHFVARESIFKVK